MRFRFSPRVTITCLVLAALMVRLSVWQWDRHLQKQAEIEQMIQRLESPIIELSTASSTLPVSELPYRRVSVRGSYDFAHEMVLRNRRYEGRPGVYALTPLRLAGSDRVVLVNRGFVPMEQAQREARGEFHRAPEAEFVGLVKSPQTQRLFAPGDPPAGQGHPWVDAWLRVDIAAMNRQLPYELLPFYVEIMTAPEEAGRAARTIVRSDVKREDVIFAALAPASAPASTDYPVPMLDAVIPAGRHLGYVYEWAFLATITLLIGAILQLRRPAPLSQ